ncbi:hypothetical protein PanWU01x14_035810, partial [Parasponia andersonii]
MVPRLVLRRNSWQVDGATRLNDGTTTPQGQGYGANLWHYIPKKIGLQSHGIGATASCD